MSRDRTKLLASRKAYRAANQERIAAQTRATKQRMHAEGRCVDCGKPHQRVSQKTRALAQRCHGCAFDASRAQCRRYAARKVAA